MSIYRCNKQKEKTVAEFSVRLLHRLLSYNPETGLLVWKQRPNWLFAKHPKTFKRSTTATWWNTRFAGKPAINAVEGCGYRSGDIFCRKIRAHRVIWAMQTGVWPDGPIDHINGVRTDNRWENLRLVCNFENAKNQKRHKSNSSGVTGVVWHKRQRKWTAAIRADGIRMHIGTFENFEAAVSARAQAEKQLGFHPNHGRVGLAGRP
jgi:hypothetical protein